MGQVYPCRVSVPQVPRLPRGTATKQLSSREHQTLLVVLRTADFPGCAVPGQCSAAERAAQLNRAGCEGLGERQEQKLGCWVM